MEIKIEPSERQEAPRCPLCREGLEFEASLRCSSCAVTLHQECAAELRRCPTIGCPGGFEATSVSRAEPAPRVANAPAMTPRPVRAPTLDPILAGLAATYTESQMGWLGVRTVFGCFGAIFGPFAAASIIMAHPNSALGFFGILLFLGSLLFGVIQFMVWLDATLTPPSARAAEVPIPPSDPKPKPGKKGRRRRGR